MPVTKEETLEEYLREVERYALISSVDSDLLPECCMVYDTKYHELHWIDNDELAHFVKNGLFDAGCNVISSEAFDRFRKPIDDWYDQSIFDGVPLKELREQRTRIPWPFPRRRT